MGADLCTAGCYDGCVAETGAAHEAAVMLRQDVRRHIVARDGLAVARDGLAVARDGLAVA